MEYKEELAKQINFKGEVVRQIAVAERLDWAVEGGLYDNRGKVESWGVDGSEYNPDEFGEIVYVFHCKDVEGHRVDYKKDNLKELGTNDDGEKEHEVLVLPQKMRVIDVLDGMDDMGFIDVELELIE